MKRTTRVWAYALISLICGIGQVTAQNAPLTPPVELQSNLAAGASDTYTFSALAGGVVSISARADGDLDPVITLLDSGGRIVISNDDFNYPDSRDALLEAVTIPRTGTYTIQVSGYNGSSGAYTFRLTPGYAQIAANETFENADGWEIGEALTTTSTDGVLSASISGIRAFDAAFYQFADPITDGYVQAHFSGIQNSSGWLVGLVTRQTNEGYYSVLINNQGLWRFVRVSAGEMTVVRDWTPHPNIVAGQTTFTLAVIASGQGFDFYYNGGYIGSGYDDAITTSGSVGIVIGTTSSLSSTTTAQVDNLVVTTPTYMDGERVIPQQLIVSSATDMQRSMEIRNLVPSNGTMALTVPESSVQFARDGVNRLMLGRGTTYTDFALAATVEIQAGRNDSLAGCGLVMRYSDDNDYLLAYIDQQGGYGVSQRQGDVFLPGIYGILDAQNTNRHQLLIVLNDTTLIYYLDGINVGTLQVPSLTGEVGTAVVNYEAVTTTCQYSDIWLWRWG